MPISIRPSTPPDWSALWPILHSTFLSGDTYAFAPDSTEAEIHEAWIERPAVTHVACDSAGQVVGTYYLKANHAGLGSHVCNAGYVVAPQVRGRGIAARLCEHSQATAIAMGFRAMQFNLVASTNEVAVRLWRKLGFDVVGTLPGAFAHRQLGDVDALVMFKTLVARAASNAGKTMQPKPTDDLPPLPELTPGRYRHYKGGLYELVGIARHSETLAPQVVYRPLYGAGGLWVRPYDMFIEDVVIDGVTQPRFAPLPI